MSLVLFSSFLFLWLVRRAYTFPCESSINMITDQIFIGDVRALGNPDFLHDIGVSHIITASTVQEVSHSMLLNTISFLRVPIGDNGIDELIPYLDSAVAFIQNAIDNGNRVLVHCVQGRSRSPSIVIAYLMNVNRWTLKQAFNHVRSKRPCVRPRYQLMEELMFIERQLNPRIQNTLKHSENYEPILL